MPITYYDMVNGQLVGETTGGVRTEYLTDALGSVTATVNSSGEIVNTYRYKPYGQLLAKTGSGEDPRYLWTGSTGSRRTLVTYAEQYNQARHYGARQAGWTTVDPVTVLGLKHPFIFCRNSPSNRSDRSGLVSEGSGCSSETRAYINDCCSRVPKINGINDDLVELFVMCMNLHGHEIQLTDAFLLLDYLRRACDGLLGNPSGADKSRPCVFCFAGETPPAPYPSGLPSACTGTGWRYCSASGTIAVTTCYEIRPSFPWQPTCGPGRPAASRDSCCEALSKSGDGCTSMISICNEKAFEGEPCGILYHELTHAGGYPHGSIKDNPRDFVYASGCCLCLILGEGGEKNKCKVTCRGFI